MSFRKYTDLISPFIFPKKTWEEVNKEISHFLVDLQKSLLAERMKRGLPQKKPHRTVHLKRSCAQLRFKKGSLLTQVRFKNKKKKENYE